MPAESIFGLPVKNACNSADYKDAGGAITVTEKPSCNAAQVHYRCTLISPVIPITASGFCRSFRLVFWFWLNRTGPLFLRQRHKPRLDHFNDAVDIINAACPGAAAGLLHGRPQTRVIGKFRVCAQLRMRRARG